MPTANPVPSALRNLTRDGWLLFLTRFVRLFAYGSLSVVLVFYLIGLGLATLLTCVSFFIARTTLVWTPSIPVALAVLAGAIAYARLPRPCLPNLACQS